MIDWREMFLARAKEVAAALVEPGKPSTPASFKTVRIHRLMVALAAALKGGMVVKNRDASLLR